MKNRIEQFEKAKMNDNRKSQSKIGLSTAIQAQKLIAKIMTIIVVAVTIVTIHPMSAHAANADYDYIKQCKNQSYDNHGALIIKKPIKLHTSRWIICKMGPSGNLISHPKNDEGRKEFQKNTIKNQTEDPIYVSTKPEGLIHIPRGAGQLKPGIPHIHTPKLRIPDKNLKRQLGPGAGRYYPEGTPMAIKLYNNGYGNIEIEASVE